MTDGPYTTAILDDLLEQAGVPRQPDERIQFSGADPVFPTRFRMGEFGAAAIAAAATQAARLHRRQSQESQRIDVDVDAAAAAMRSWRYLNQDPAGRRLERAPVGYYRTRDGRWLLLHKMLDHHYERELAVLRCSPHEEAISAAIAGWEGRELEDAIMSGGGCAALVRSPEEWAQHPQAAAVADLPLFRITKLGSSAPEPVGTADRPLAGVRVVDATRVLAGPTAGRTLAEQGADVIRINPPGLREHGPMPLDTGHGKRAAELDLRSKAGQDRMRDLLRDADVFCQGYRPGGLDSFGFSPPTVSALRPGIVTVSISAWGPAGPWADRRGYDSLVQAVSGLAAEGSGSDDRPRSLPGNPLDYVTGYLAAFLIEVALARRASEGGSYHVELSLAQTGRYLAGLPLVDAASASRRPDELAPERLNELTMERQTPAGRLRYLKPAARLSRTPARWERPSVPPDHDEPRW